MAKKIIPMLMLAFSVCQVQSLSKTTPISGPGIGQIGEIAQIILTPGHLFFEKKDVKEFMQNTNNIYSEKQMGILMNGDKSTGYWALFSFDEIGFIKDAEKESLDDSRLWREMLKYGIHVNEKRAAKNLSPIKLVNWELKPRYLSANHRLEWAVRLSENDMEYSNYNIVILGRRGVMRVILVPLGGYNLEKILPRFHRVISGFKFLPGHQYSDWTAGDKTASFGLSALIIGGTTSAGEKMLFSLPQLMVIVSALGILTFILFRAWKRTREPSNRIDDSPLSGNSR